MKTVTIKAMRELIAELRAVPPKRPLTYGESLQVTRIQAAKLRRWAGAATEPDINLIWLVKQQAVPVNFVASHILHEESGLTTDHVDGRLQVFINNNEPDVRQRFTVLHEFKHVLDFEHADVLHARLGNGNAEVQKDMIEWIANEFAGHVLMPTGLVKRLWFSTQNVPLMANMFNVSVEAMTTRLEILGFIGTPKPAPRVYFRTRGVLICARLDKPHLATMFERSTAVDELVAA